MWRAHLRELKLDAIYFDAYAADHADDAFVSFSSEIIRLVDKRFSEVTGVQEPRREFKKTAIKVGKRLAGLATKIAIRAGTLGAVEAAHVEELKDIGTEAASGISEIGSETIEEQIENYTLKKDTLKEFRQSLAKLAKVVREQQEFPLTIIVDELDRCRPDFALALLERIKHLFDVENVAFVLLVNRDQIEGYIHKVYGDEVDAELICSNLEISLSTCRHNRRSRFMSPTIRIIARPLLVTSASSIRQAIRVFYCRVWNCSQFSSV